MLRGRRPSSHARWPASRGVPLDPRRGVVPGAARRRGVTGGPPTQGIPLKLCSARWGTPVRAFRPSFRVPSLRGKSLTCTKYSRSLTAGMMQRRLAEFTPSRCWHALAGLDGPGAKRIRIQQISNTRTELEFDEAGDKPRGAMGRPISAHPIPIWPTSLGGSAGAAMTRQLPTLPRVAVCCLPLPACRFLPQSTPTVPGSPFPIPFPGTGHPPT